MPKAAGGTSNLKSNAETRAKSAPAKSTPASKTTNVGGTMSGVRDGGKVESKVSGGTQSGVRSGVTTRVGLGDSNKPAQVKTSLNNRNPLPGNSNRELQYGKGTFSTPNLVDTNLIKGGNLPASQEAVVRQQTLGKPSVRNRVFAPERIAPGSEEAAYLANQYRAYKNPSIFEDAAPTAEPDRNFNVGVIDTPRLAADPTNYNRTFEAPGSLLGEGLASMYAADPQIAGRLAEANRPGAGVPDLPVRGNTIFKSSAAFPKMQDRLPQEDLYAGSVDVQPQNYNFSGLQQTEGDIPIPRQNPLSDTSKFQYPPGRDRDYIFGSGSDQEMVSRLAKTQDIYGDPITLTSGYRPPALNKDRGGVGGSVHLRGGAIDMAVPDKTGEDTARLISAAKQAGFTGMGGYRPGKVHADIGNERIWGPDTHASSIPQLPKSMQAALRDPNITQASYVPKPQPKPNLLDNVARPLATKAVDAGKAVGRSVARTVNGIFNPNGEVPIPRQKPAVRRAPEEGSNDPMSEWLRLYQQTAGAQ
jgi:hypothetical protein